MNIEGEIFKRKQPVYDRLLKFGFILNNGTYIYKTKISDNFEMIVEISENIRGKIIDLDFEEEYTNYRNENLIGGFVGEVKDKFIKVLKDICDKCFEDKYFITDQANRIAYLIKNKYGDDPLFKWENNDAAVFENNSKWYAIIMNIDRSKIESKNGEVEIINVKLDKNKVLNLLNKKGFYKAYHMNKKYWITITLDDNLSDEEIIKLIEESYSYTLDTIKSKNEWVMPINPHYFDVFNYFDSTGTFYWEQKKSFKKDDIIYLYVTKPVGSIMYKFRVQEFKDGFMVVKKIKKYDENLLKLEKLKKYGLTSVRSSRHIPEKLSKYIKECDL